VASILSVYRLWLDLGYAVGTVFAVAADALGLAAAMPAPFIVS
jgi:hypothetical protein